MENFMSPYWPYDHNTDTHSTHHPLCHCFECKPRVGRIGFSALHPYNCDCIICINSRVRDSREYNPHRPTEAYFIPLENTSPKETKEPEEMNVNLNLFLRMLGATNEIIDDDQKTLEFMFEVKKKLDLINSDGVNNEIFGKFVIKDGFPESKNE